MSTFSRILCPVDLSDDSRRALRYAGVTAKWYGARLTVLHVFPEAQTVDIIPALVVAGVPAPGLPPSEHVRLREMATQFIDSEIPPGLDVELRLPDGRDAAREIAYEAATLDSDLIVMGTHARHGYQRWREGSIAEFVARAARCPVIVIPPGADAPIAPGDEVFGRILCAVDFSEGSLDALSAALSLAEDADANLTLLHVTKPDDRDPLHLQHLRQLVPESAGVFCRIDALGAAGTPAHEILAVAGDRRCHLIVMGASARGALDRFLFGSTTRDVLQGAACPVFIQRGS